MLTKRLFPMLLAATAAALVAGCDRSEAPATQGVDAGGAAGTSGSSASSDAQALPGVIDRSFAGGPLPAVTVTDPSGATLALAETAGQPVLLNLWATWCAPCVVEMPLLNDLAGELEGKVRVLTVSEDLNGGPAVSAFFAERQLPNLPQWIDLNGDLAVAFGGGAVLPLTVLYDAQGREVWRVIGAYDWASEEARAAVLEGARGG